MRKSIRDKFIYIFFYCINVTFFLIKVTAKNKLFELWTKVNVYNTKS
jgi:hypothetical protein